MQLSHVLNRDLTQDVNITGVTADSRRVRSGYLFAALPGTKADGAKYIEDAILHGAVAILAGENVVPPSNSDVVLITDKNPRLALAMAAARYYNAQPETIVAVTGTSGKTSTVSFTQQLWSLLHIEKSASLGTLGVRGPGLVRSGTLTTPDTVSLHAELADLAAVGITHLAMEASSHGIDQYRLDGVNIKVAGFTNMSRDHLDYHIDMDAYFEAKAQLFARVMNGGGTCVLNADDEYYEDLLRICANAGHHILSYGEKATDIVLKRVTAQPLGQDIVVAVNGEIYSITLPLVGRFQVMNALLALGLVLATEGIEKAKDIVPLLAQLRGVPGRLQLVEGHPRGAAIYVDYAHKPAAVEAVLSALRTHTNGDLVCVIGCGGDRDTGKRPVMGRIAAELADRVIITDDNPRGEDPQKIRAQMREGAPNAIEIGDRAEAIEQAVGSLKQGDVLVVAGKGHEQGQIIGDVTKPFDDTEEILKAIKKLNEKEA